MVALIYIGVGSGAREYLSQLHTTRFRRGEQKGELRLPLQRPWAFLTPPSLASLHSTPDRAGGYDRQHFHQGLGGGGFPI